jgi:RNA methyltransferase, TrmH family
MKKFKTWAEINVDVINSTANRHLKLYRSLGKRKTRKETGLLPLEGLRLVTEAVVSGAKVELILLHEEQEADTVPAGPGSKPPVYRVAARLFEQIAHTESPQGIIAVAQKPAYRLGDVFRGTPSLLLVADSLQDPGNLGTMVRSAAAAGAGGAVLLPGTVDISNPKALRATMGALFRMPVVEANLDELLPRLRQYGLRLVATDAKAVLAYDKLDWREPAAVVVGNEGAGVSAEILAAADSTISVPMCAGVESLNAAIAMSVIFFEAARQRRGSDSCLPTDDVL